MTDPVDDDRPLTTLELIKYLRSQPPRPGFPRQTLEEIALEQGIKGPIDFEEWQRESPGPFYEGFEEDIRRMRRGLPPIGPRK
jgi:hypothetical protein